MEGPRKKLLRNKTKLGKYVMGKKKKRKKKKRGKIYTKTQFIDIICGNCGLCGHKPNPVFCYVKMFKKEPLTFTNEIWPKLSEFSAWLKGQPTTTVAYAFMLDDLKRVFCRSGICGETKRVICQDSFKCYGAFRAQFLDKDKRDEKNEKNKRNKPVILRAYPTFFSSKDETWQNLIKEILDGED